MEFTWKDWTILAAGFLALVFMVATCSSPRAKETFEKRCETFCEDLNSEVLFCNPSRKVVFCE